MYFPFCTTVASRAASWIPQKFTRVPEQKYQRTQRESQSNRWHEFASANSYRVSVIAVFNVFNVYLHESLFLSDRFPDLAAPTLNFSSQKVYGEPLLSHLSQSNREIAAPIQECIHMLLRTGMREEVGLRGWESFLKFRVIILPLT